MQTVPYSEVLGTIQALCGVTNFNAQEKARIRLLANRRAKKAYVESNYWPRYLQAAQMRAATADGRIGSDVTIDTFLRIFPNKPFARCSTPEYQFYADGVGANLANYCGEKIKVGTINNVLTTSGIAILTVADPVFSFWRSFLISNVSTFTFEGIEGTPFDAALNVTVDASVQFDDVNFTIQFFPDPTLGQQAMFVDGPTSPFVSALCYNVGPVAGKASWTNTGLPITAIPQPDGQYIEMFWTTGGGGTWELIVYDVVGGVATATGQWESHENVDTPDLVTTWTPILATVGLPVVRSENVIVDSNTAVNGSASTFAVYVTYKAQLTDTFGDGTTDQNLVPREWSEYIIQGTYADWLRAEGQNDKAQAEDAIAEDILSYELQKIDSQHIGESVANRVFTVGNTQARNF